MTTEAKAVVCLFLAIALTMVAPEGKFYCAD